MSNETMEQLRHVAVGQRIRVTTAYPAQGSGLAFERVNEGTIAEVIEHDGKITAVVFDEDLSGLGGATPVYDTESGVKVTIEGLGWPVGVIAYVDICEDGNPGHPDETDVLVIRQDGHWERILYAVGKEQSWWDYNAPELVTNIRVVHDGKVPQ